MTLLDHLSARALRVAVAFLPSGRREWGEAMESELAAVPGRRARAVFALGCIAACLKEGTAAMDFAIRSVRILSILLMLGVAAASANSASRLSESDASIAFVLAMSGTFFVAAAAWTYLRGPLALIQAASTMTLVYAMAMLFTRFGSPAAEHWPNAAFYRALSAEGLTIWLILLVAGNIARSLGRLSPPETTAA